MKGVVLTSFLIDFIKLLENIPQDNLITLIPSPAPLRASLSSKTPGIDLEDRWSLDKLPNVGS